MKKVFLFLLSMIFFEVSMASSSSKSAEEYLLDLFEVLLEKPLNNEQAQKRLDEIINGGNQTVLNKKMSSFSSKTLVFYFNIEREVDSNSGQRMDSDAMDFLYKNKQYFTNDADQQILNAYQKQKESRVAQKPLEALGSPMSKNPQLSIKEYLDSQSVNQLDISRTRDRISPHSKNSRIKGRRSPTKPRGSVDSSSLSLSSAPSEKPASSDTSASDDTTKPQRKPLEKQLSRRKLEGAPAPSTIGVERELKKSPSSTDLSSSSDKPAPSELTRTNSSLFGSAWNSLRNAASTVASLVSSPEKAPTSTTSASDEKKETIEQVDPRVVAAHVGIDAQPSKKEVVSPVPSSSGVSSVPKPESSASLSTQKTASSSSFKPQNIASPASSTPSSIPKPTVSSSSSASAGGSVDSSSNTKASVAQPAPSSASASSTPSPFVSTVDSLSTTAAARERFGDKGKDREVTSERRDEPRLNFSRKKSVKVVRGAPEHTPSDFKLGFVETTIEKGKRAVEEASVENQLMSGAFNALSKSFQYKKPLNQENFEKAVAEMQKKCEKYLSKVK